MIEVAHRQHGSPSFRAKSSPSSAASSSRSTPDLAPLPVQHLRAPPSPLFNNFSSSTFSDEEESGVRREDTKDDKSEQSVDSASSATTASKGTTTVNGKRNNSIKRNQSGKSSISSSIHAPAKINTNPSSTVPKAKSPLSRMVGVASPPERKSALVHRVRKGQKIEDFHPPVSADLPPLQSIDSAFQLQEYLDLLIRQDVHNVDRVVAVPQPGVDHSSSSSSSSAAAASLSPSSSSKPSPLGADADKGKARDGESQPFGGMMMEEEAQTVDTDVWIYEQLRRIVLDFSTPWLTELQKDCDKKKKPKTCEAMYADDWMYLCASHGEEKQCCAIDYIIHTLDGTTALLNSQRHFPSRTYIPSTSLRHFGSISRRLTRIFVHAYEQHRDVFEVCEAETALYARFIALVQTYDLSDVESLLNMIKKSQKTDTAAATAATASGEEGKEDSSNVAEPSAEVDKEESAEQSKGRGGGKGQLFETDAPAATDEDDEEGEEEENETGEVGGEGGEEEESSGGRLQRSDSVVSRVRAKDAGSSGKDQATSSTDASQSKSIAESEYTREKSSSQEGVPQDVKDDEDEEV